MNEGARTWLLAAVATWSLAGCGACDGESPLEKQGDRVWGRDLRSARAQERAKETIRVQELDRAPVRERVLTMTWAEVVARVGLVRYEGVAVFKLSRNKKTFKVTEKTLIEEGLYSSWHVLQRDADDTPLRETYFHNGRFYLRNGPGQLREAGIKNPRVSASRQQAWEPLESFTNFFGQRLGLSADGGASLPLGRALRYQMVMVDGSEHVTVPGIRGKKKPLSIKGRIWVLESSGVVAKAKFSGTLEIPPPAPMQPPGVLNVSLDFTLKPGAERELKPEKFISTITRRPVDLDPLAFLDGGTRTSTVIGGNR